MPFFILAILLLVANSKEPLLLFFSCVVLYVLYRLFWRRNEPKAIIAGLTLFWLSIVVKVFYADIFGKDFIELSISPNIVNTAYLSMLSLLVFSFAIHLIIKNITAEENIFRSIAFNVEDYNLIKVAIVYILSIVAKILLEGILFVVSGLSQVINALITLRQGVIFIMIYFFYKKTKSIKFPIALVLIEILMSFFSYFSNFKDLIIFFIVSITFFRIKFKVKQLASILSVGAVCLYLLLIWQAVKGQYRNFLSGGERSQVVVVERSEALNQFIYLASNANVNDADLWYESIDRLSYIEFFSQATDNVPEYIPFENGNIWKRNIKHVLFPRFLNPGKKVIDDSEMVNQYATRKVAGANEGASFSLGFLAESYIDFGYVIMFVPVFLIGLLFGFIYKYILTNSYNYTWGCAFVSPLWVYFFCNGTPGAKILGWLIMYLLVFFFVDRYAVRRIDTFLRNK